MTVLADYGNKYETVSVQREDGILQVTFHSGDGSLLWGEASHRELGYAFADIGADPDNRVAILTGTGDDYCADFEPNRPTRRMPRDWDKTYWEGKRLLTNLLEIEVPIIGAVNGPTTIHAEIPVMPDIVLASETATFPGRSPLPARRGARRRRPRDLAPGVGTERRPALPADRADAIGTGGVGTRRGGRSAPARRTTAKGLGSGPAVGGTAAADVALHPRCPHAATEAADAVYARIRSGRRRPCRGRRVAVARIVPGCSALGSTCLAGGSVPSAMASRSPSTYPRGSDCSTCGRTGVRLRDS